MSSFVFVSLVAFVAAQTSLSCNAWVNIENATVAPVINATATGTAIVISNTTGTFFFLNGAQVRVNGSVLNDPVIAHVHELPCNVGAGGHFKFDKSITTAVQTNELWASPNITTGQLAPQGQSPWNGAGSHLGALNDSRKAELASVVIHNGTPKLVCCNLLAEITTTGSTVTTTASNTTTITVVGTSVTTTGANVTTTGTNVASTSSGTSITSASNTTGTLITTTLSNTSVTTLASTVSATTAAPTGTTSSQGSSTSANVTVDVTTTANSTLGTTNGTAVDVPCTTSDCCAAYEEKNQPCVSCLTNSGCTFYATFNNDVVQLGGQCLLKTAEAPSLRNEVNVTTSCADYCSVRTCEDCIQTSASTGCVWCDTVKATTGLNGKPTCETKKCSFGSKPFTTSNVCASASTIVASSIALVVALCAYFF